MMEHSSTDASAVQQTLELVTEALSHFDASAFDEVEYSSEPVTTESVQEVWQKDVDRHLWSFTHKGTMTRYGDEPVFSPDWMNGLTEHDHRSIAAFVEKNKFDFWAINSLAEAMIHPVLSLDPEYRYLLQNLLLLWDSTNQMIEERYDCYTLPAIRGIGCVNVGALSSDEQDGYRALAGFAAVTYIAGLDGKDGDPDVVREVIVPGSYVVQEPYRSMALKYPNQTGFMFRYLKDSYSEGDEHHLAELLAQNTPAPLMIGLL